MLKQIFFILFLLVPITVAAQTETTVYFNFDRYELTNETKQVLDTLAANNTIVSAAIYGHCDQLGSQEYNYALSERRANAVKNYLVSKGISEGNITTLKGFGEDHPAINKLDKTSRTANRRVTIVSTYAIAKADTVVTPKKPVIDTPATAVTPAPKVQKREKLVDEIKDTSTKTGQNIILRNINFYGGSHRFLPTAYPPLQDLLEAMQQIPTLVIEIQGHICCRDDDGDGLDHDTGEPFLSHNRARAVYEFLLRRDINRRRMTYKGYAHKFPLYDYELTEEERTANRRVEIKIIKK